MELNNKKVWICVSIGSNGVTTGYFSSVVQELSEHVVAFIICLGAQVDWWLSNPILIVFIWYLLLFLANLLSIT